MRRHSIVGVMFCLAALALAGCTTTDGGWQGTYRLCVVNRSNELLQDVIIRDADKKMRHFENVKPSGGKKVIDNCTIDLKGVFGIVFYVNGQRNANLLTLNACLPVKDRIKTLYFYYLGKYEWSIIANDAAGKELVKPDHTSPHK